MTPDTRLSDLPMTPPVVLPPATSVAVAMRRMLETGVPYILSELDGAPAVLTRADVDRVLPSPATSLARYEVSARLERVTIRHALRAPSTTLPVTATVAEAVRRLRDAAWAPLIVYDRDAVVGIVTAEIVAEQLVGVEETG